MPDRLIKFCAKKYNPTLGASTLQLGTFEYYRNLDQGSAIVDPAEAMHTVTFKEGLEIKVDESVGNRLFGGRITGDDLTMVAGPGAFFRVTIHNAYIFCVSRLTSDNSPSLEQAASIEPSYDSMWEITDRHRFRDAIGAALLEVITVTDLTPESQQALSSLPIGERALQVQMLDRPVEYLESREHAIRDHGDLAGIPDYQESLARAIFRKDQKDAHQLEHRFAYMITNPKLGQLSVSPTPVRIQLSRLYRCISSVS